MSTTRIEVISYITERYSPFENYFCKITSHRSKDLISNNCIVYNDGMASKNNDGHKYYFEDFHVSDLCWQISDVSKTISSAADVPLKLALEKAGVLQKSFESVSVSIPNYELPDDDEKVVSDYEKGRKAGFEEAMKLLQDHFKETINGIKS